MNKTTKTKAPKRFNIERFEQAAARVADPTASSATMIDSTKAVIEEMKLHRKWIMSVLRTRVSQCVVRTALGIVSDRDREEVAKYKNSFVQFTAAIAGQEADLLVYQEWNRRNPNR